MLCSLPLFPVVCRNGKIVGHFAGDSYGRLWNFNHMNGNVNRGPTLCGGEGDLGGAGRSLYRERGPFQRTKYGRKFCRNVNNWSFSSNPKRREFLGVFFRLEAPKKFFTLENRTNPKKKDNILAKIRENGVKSLKRGLFSYHVCCTPPATHFSARILDVGHTQWAHKAWWGENLETKNKLKKNQKKTT